MLRPALTVNTSEEIIRLGYLQRSHSELWQYYSQPSYIHTNIYAWEYFHIEKETFPELIKTKHLFYKTVFSQRKQM